MTTALHTSKPAGASPGRRLAGPEAERMVMDLLRAGGAARFAATGHSMTPAIRSGDRLTVEPLRALPDLSESLASMRSQTQPDSDISPGIGAVLACESEGRLVVHRLVRREAGRALVRGDAAPAPDPPLAAGAVLGVVARIERAGRPVRFGLGRERVVIAWLSRCGLLRVWARWRERLRLRPKPRRASRACESRLALPVSELLREGSWR